MKYLITGYNGFLGKNLLEELQKDSSNEFFLLGRNSWLWETSYDIIEFQPDYIINMAAEIYEDGNKMWYSNIVFLKDLLEILDDVPYKKFIQVGSSSEYGYKKNPMAESDILEPRTMYEATKGMATLYCQGYSNSYNKPITVVRPFSVYGKHDRDHKFIPTIIKAFINKTDIKISEGVHDFIHVDDFTEALMKIIHIENNKLFDIVNVGSSMSWSNVDVYEILCDIFGYKIPMERLKDKLRPFDTMTWEADVEKLVNEYGFIPTLSMTKGLKKTINEYIK